MSKYFKIVLILSVISLSLVFYIVLSAKRLTVTSEDTSSQNKQTFNDNEVEKISQEQINENYQVSINGFWTEYEKTIEGIKNLSFEQGDKEKNQDEDLNGDSIIDKESSISEYNDKIVKLRIEAMSYTVPEKNKDMHLKLVMSLSFLKSYLDTRVDENKEKALSLYMEAKDEYQKL